MNSKSILIMVLFLIWGAGSWHWYTCKVKGLCNNQETQVVTPDPEPDTQEMVTPPAVTAPLSFNWSDAQAQVGADFEDLTAKLANGIVGDRVLEITGLYHPDEENTSSYENLGWARAHTVKNLLATYLDTNKVTLAVRSLEDAPQQTNSFEAVDFSFPLRSKFVKEVGESVLIYFPFNSTEEELDPSITQYLEDLVSKAQKDGRSVSITGHTDDIGNYDLGLARANSIKEVLVGLGMDQSEILTASKGEDQPIANNANAEGRKLNRRIELTLN